MSTAHLGSLKILWITLQMILLLIGFYSVNAEGHFHPYISEFEYNPRYHPSRNPTCASQWSRSDFYEGQFDARDRRYSSFEEPFVDQSHSWIKIRAVLIRCPRTSKDVKRMSHRQPIRDCKKKVVISMKINNVGKMNTREEFILVDHILDPVKMHKIRLRNPYVIKIRQAHLLHLYGLKFQGIVNAEAKEEVINNHRVNYTGCNDGTENPTCGQMFIDGKTIPFSQGFCCSCKSWPNATLQHAGSSHLDSKSNHQWDRVDEARNRFESSVNLFDNPQAQRQFESSPRRNERQHVDHNVDGDGVIQSPNISIVNHSLNERVSLRRNEEKHFENNSSPHFIQTLDGLSWMTNETNTLSPVFKSVFFDPMQTRGKIEAYIDSINEEAMKERASIKKMDDTKNLSGDHVGNFSDARIKTRELIRLFDRTTDNSQSMFYKSITDDPRDTIVKVTKLESVDDFLKLDNERENREFLEPVEAKSEESVNFSESGNRRVKQKNQSCSSVNRLENTSDYTSTSRMKYFSAVDSRIPGKNQFSRQKEKNVPFNGDNTPSDNKNFTVGLRNSMNKNINCDIIPSMATSLNNTDGFVLLSRIMVAEVNTSTDDAKRPPYLRFGNISDNIKVSKDLSVKNRNPSITMVVNDNTIDKPNEKITNLSTRISGVSIFTGLHNLSLFNKKTAMLPQSFEFTGTHVDDEAPMRIVESKIPKPLQANEIPDFSENVGDLYENPKLLHRANKSFKQMLKGTNLKNSYKFWKHWRNLRKSKKGDVRSRAEGNNNKSNIRENVKHLNEKFLLNHEWRRKRASPDLKYSRFGKGIRSKRRRYLMTHLRNKEIDSKFTNASNLNPKDKYLHNQYDATRSKHKILKGVRYENSKHVTLATERFHRKIQSDKSDNPFLTNENIKVNNIDKRIEDDFLRISNVLKEDSIDGESVQEVTKNFKEFAKDKVTNIDIPRIRHKRPKDLFPQRRTEKFLSTKLNDTIKIQNDKFTHENTTQSSKIYQKSSTIKEIFPLSIKSAVSVNEITTISSPIVWKNDSIVNEHKESLKTKNKLLTTSIVDVSLSSSPIKQKFEFPVSKGFIEVSTSTDGSTNLIAKFIESTTVKPTKFFTQQISLEIPNAGIDHFVTRPLQTGTRDLSTVSSNPEETTKISETWKDHSKNEEDNVDGSVRFLKFGGNHSSQMIAVNSNEAKSPLIKFELSLHKHSSVTVPEAEHGTTEFQYIEAPCLETPEDTTRSQNEESHNFQKKSEIAELVERVARQYIRYTPIMPELSIIEEITESKTLSPEDTTVTEISTIMDTTTRITNDIIRPSIRPLESITMSLAGEKHDEVSLDESTFVDETEATITTQRFTTSRWRSQIAEAASKEEARRVMNKTARKTKKLQQQQAVKRVITSSTRTTDDEKEQHPWYRTTKIQHIIAASKLKPIQKIKREKRKHFYKSKIKHHNAAAVSSGNWSLATTDILSVIDNVTLARTRNKRSDLTRERRDVSILNNRKKDEKIPGRRVLCFSKNVESRDITEPIGLRSGIERRSVDGLDYSANQLIFLQHNRKNEEQILKPMYNVFRDTTTAVTMHNIESRSISNDNERYFRNVNTLRKEYDLQNGLETVTSLLLLSCHDKKCDRNASNLNEHMYTENNEVHLTSWSSLSTYPAKISGLRRDISRLPRESMKTGQRTRKMWKLFAHGEKFTDTDMILAKLREIMMNVSENVKAASMRTDDLSLFTKLQKSIGRILLVHARRSVDNQNKSTATDTVVSGVKLIVNDKDESPDHTAKSIGKKILSLFPVTKQRHKYTDRIDGNPAGNERTYRISVRRKYSPCPRGKICDTVRGIIGNIKKRKPLLVLDEVRQYIARNKEYIDHYDDLDSSLVDWRPSSGRRLLSHARSSYIEDLEDDDDDYGGDENEMDSENDSLNDNEVVARSDGLDIKTRLNLCSEERDCRKDRKIIMNKSTEFKDRLYDTDTVLEPIISINFNNKNKAKVSLAKTKESTLKHTVDNDVSIQKQNFDEAKDIQRNPEIYEKTDRELFLLNEQTSNTPEDDSLFEIHPLSTTESFAVNNQAQTIVDEMVYNVTSAKCSVAWKKDGKNFKISLTGRIQLNDSSNQPMLISIDTVPIESPLSASFNNNSAISGELLNVSPIIEATHTNFPVDYSIIVHSLDTSSSTTEHLDYEIMNDTLEKMSNDNRRQSYMTNTNRKAGKINVREKFFDLAAGSEKERQNNIGESFRIEKRLNKDNANSKTAQQIFLTDYSSGPSIVSSNEISRTNVARMSFTAAATDEATDKLDSGLSANPIYFPDIFGSVLVRNDTVENFNMTEKVSRCRVDLPSTPIEVNRSDSTTTIRQTNMNPIPLIHIRLYPEKSSFYDPTSDDRNNTRMKCCPDRYSRNATSGGCYIMPVTIRKLEFPETTTSTLSTSQTSYSYRDSDPGAFKSETPGPSTNDWNAETTTASLSMELQDRDAFEKNETLLSKKVSTICNQQNESINTIHMRNMMAILEFMMKLLRIITKTEDSANTKILIEDTIPNMKNVIVDSNSRGSNYDNGNEREQNIVEQRNTSDKTIVTSKWTKQQDRTTTEWHSTNVESIRVESLLYQDGSFEPFTEMPVASTLLTTSDEVLKYEEGLSTFLESSVTTERTVYVTVLSSVISTAKSKSFLFYEPGRKSFRGRTEPSKNTRINLSVTRKNSNISYSDLEGDSRRGKSHFNNNQADCSFTRATNGDGSSIDRSSLGKQTAAHRTNPIKNSERIERKYFVKRLPAMNESVELRRPESTDVNNDTIRSMLSRKIDISLRKTDAARRNKVGCWKKPTERNMMSASERQVRIRSLNSAARNGSHDDLIRNHRAIMQLPIDRKLEVSREARPNHLAIPNNKVTLGRYVAGKNIKRSRDRYTADNRNDSFRLAEYNSGSGLRLSEENGTLSITSGELDLLVKAIKKTNPIQYSPISSICDSSRGSSSCGPIVNKHMNGYTSFSNKKREISKHENSRKSNKVSIKQQKTTRKKGKKRKKKPARKNKETKKQHTRNTMELKNQWRFRRHLLMTSPGSKSTYDTDDHYNTKRRSARGFLRSVNGNLRQREDEIWRTVDRSKVNSDRRQIRGGQDCTDRYGHPSNVDVTEYLESAHCLRFSDLWYSVYQLEDPIVEHTLYLQIYEKRFLPNGSMFWKELTGNSVVRLGTFNRRYRTRGEDTIAFAYKEEVKMTRREEVPNLDVARDRLFVPSSVTSKDFQYPVEGQSSEYLVVQASNINVNGDECDKAGVGFAAFARQSDRCERVKGTCLKNQPLAYHRHDVEARAAGRPGCYFLSNFASVPSEPIKYNVNGNGNREFLALEYHSPHVSAIDIEIRPSYAVLPGGSSGCINEVHVDNRAFDHTVITIVIMNTGTNLASYQSRIMDCPSGLPDSWMNIRFPREKLHYRQNQEISLSLYGELPVNEFYCSVQLLNYLGEPVANRNIKIRKMDRCSCVSYCSCVCMGDANRDTDCRLMSYELYQAAGFRGSVPTSFSGRGIFSNTTMDILLCVISFVLLLLLLGFLKWLIGLYIPAVGRWGLDLLLKIDEMPKYYEQELKCKCVVRDEYGAPVHPDTRKRTVRITSRKMEFLLNTVFFLLFPFAMCYFCLRKIFLLIRRRCCSDKSKISLSKNKREQPEMICMSTYGDTRNSKMEAEDTKYVIDELKKSEESLRSHSRSKVDTDIDDTIVAFQRSRCVRECRSYHSQKISHHES